ncbi:MAG: nucleotidyltransferase family protein [Thermoleophilaceae bacterium]
MIAGCVLAAGRASRFGAPKQLAELHGRPLLEHVPEAMSQAGLDRVVVVLGAEADQILDAVVLHGAEPVLCERWAQGQSASLASGLAAVQDAEAVVVTLGDQPGLSPDAVRRVLAARGGHVGAVRATYDGRPGHPVVLERAQIPALRDVTGDVGARNVITRGVREVACDDLGGGEDVDTPGQLAGLRRAETRR